MPLEDEIRNLGSRAQKALEELHDFYTHTKIAWQVVQLYSNEGHKLNVRNKTTGSVLNEQDLLGRAQGYITGQLASGTFKDSFAIFEEFLFGLLRLWLTRYPGSLSDLEIKFARVLQAGSLESLTQELIGERLNRRQYKGVKDWFKYVNSQISLDVPNADQINRIAEIKASRDILEHHQAIVNGEYRRKAGSLARFDVGDRLEIPEHYHRESWTLLRDIVRDVTAAAATKAERAAAGR